MEDNTTTCKNCEEEHELGFEFCPHCGQKLMKSLLLESYFITPLAIIFLLMRGFSKALFR